MWKIWRSLCLHTRPAEVTIDARIAAWSRDWFGWRCFTPAFIHFSLSNVFSVLGVVLIEHVLCPVCGKICNLYRCIHQNSMVFYRQFDQICDIVSPPLHWVKWCVAQVAPTDLRVIVNPFISDATVLTALLCVALVGFADISWFILYFHFSFFLIF